MAKKNQTTDETMETYVAKIQYQEMFGKQLGITCVFSRRIFLDQDLKKFNQLHDMVLKHELGHLQDKNIWQCLMRDIKDYPKIILHPQTIEMHKLKSKYNRNILIFGFLFYNIIIMLYANTLFTIAMFKSQLRNL